MPLALNDTTISNVAESEVRDFLINLFTFPAQYLIKQ